jgi:Xaa-Pro dipeptidase
MRLTREKLMQAEGLVRETGLDAWITFVRETSGGSDPILPLILDGGLTWLSVLVVTKAGKRIAVVGNYDAEPLEASGDWHEVVPYVQGIRETLIEVLEREVETERPKLGVNFSKNDPKADGLTHGMFLLLEEMFADSRFAGCLSSAEPLVMALRGRKTSVEVDRMRAAIRETDRLFSEAEAYARPGVSEREVYDHLQGLIDGRGLGYGWDRAGNPIVNSGPNSMIGHGIPSPEIRIEGGHIFHIDLGVIVDGYSSDIQRCWYVPREGETAIPEDVQRALQAVNAAISAGAKRLRPGVQGWEVDAAARQTLVDAGYPEYLHALGHQVGRQAHDGGAILGPRWERYGETPRIPVHEGEVYTLELGITVEGRGYLGLEEMVRVTADGCEWLSRRQTEMPFLGA